MSQTTQNEAASLKGVDAQVAARQTWMGLLARADAKALEKAWLELEDKPTYTVLRTPEIGMVMVRARTGGEGQQFNFGEMSVTRCVVRTDTGHQGHAYIAGRNKTHATIAAVLDALLQVPERREALDAEILEPIRSGLNRQDNETADKVAATRVDFFTLVRGDD
jgi:alpha-D-ribose 1-methylphosphonate 5-triphosphate synthase subunit PhnG